MNQNDFTPIDRLLEFGLSIAVVQKMAQSFDVMVNNCLPPQMPFPNKNHMPIEWYYSIDTTIHGPIGEQEVKHLLLTKKINSATMMWTFGMNSWCPAGEVPQIIQYITQLPPAI